MEYVHCLCINEYWLHNFHDHAYPARIWYFVAPRRSGRKVPIAVRGFRGPVDMRLSYLKKKGKGRRERRKRKRKKNKYYQKIEIYEEYEFTNSKRKKKEKKVKGVNILKRVKRR